MKRIFKYVVEKSSELLEEKIVRIIVSVIVYFASEHILTEKMSIEMDPEFVLLFSIFVMIMCYFLLKWYEVKPHKYVFYIRGLKIIFDYAGDDITVRKDFSVRINRLYAEKMYMRSTWFSDETFAVQCLSNGYKIENIGRLGNDIEYYVVFPKRKYFWNKVEFSLISYGANKNRKFKNFYWYDVIAPTKRLWIDVRIPLRYCKNLVELQRFREHKGSRTFHVDKIEYDGSHLWKIPKAKLNYSYVFEWEWSVLEEKIISKKSKKHKEKNKGKKK